ncbi:hypothetical protein PBCVOR070422_931L [Paramecium bursaria Chlorella virus OR0704.2.2]|nr:hypothetical protein PBCVOR070422_931L [Paramecium bursaria Chlorella virus OR0704.2.2]
MPDYLSRPLKYYFDNDENPVVFSKYTIDDLGIIKHKESGKTPSYGNGEYNNCVVYDNDGNQRNIRVARAVASTFLGKPPTLAHTADHIESKQKKNDALTNIRWLCRSGQSSNQNRPETYKAAFIVIKDGIEKTVNEWVEHMNATKLSKECEFTYGMIAKYAQRKQRGFTYKEYPDLDGEIWKKIEGSNNKKGHWDISNMNRVKWNTKYAENVLWGERLRRLSGYPIVNINQKHWMCHILAFKTFYPESWAAKKPEEMVLHEDDNKGDFRPHKLRLGTHSDNGKDSHDNGNRDGTRTARKKCASYIDGVLEKDDYTSLTDAAEYLKSKGYSKASYKHIGQALSGDRKSAYGRMWQKIV